MKQMTDLLNAHPQVSGYKINIRNKESYELFFVKSKLETVRCTDTCDKEVTVYVDHGEFRGDAQFFVYPSTTVEQLAALIDEAVAKSLLINNKHYELPAAEEGDFKVESNFSAYDSSELAAAVSKAVFEANQVEHAALNSVEVFVNKYTETVVNSRGLRKTQVKYDAMVEAIPTYNGEEQSVELYEQYNFGSFNEEVLKQEIANKMNEVKARYEAVQPQNGLACKVILNAQELAQLLSNIAYDLNYAAVYSHSNLFKKGDAIQKAPEGDLIGITMAGETEGSVRSAKFDGDGMSLTSIRLVEGGKAVNYFGSNRYGQYLGEPPTGDLRCLCADAGSLPAEAFAEGPYLEVVSMSGLQVDFYSDYIGGEVRLAYYHDGSKITPVTGISISGSLAEVLNHIRLSARTTVYNGYNGPEKAMLDCMKIF